MSDGQSRELAGPIFSEQKVTPNPKHFKVKHQSDTAAYEKLDTLAKEKKVKTLPFPAPRGGVEPTLSLAEVLGGGKDAKEAVADLESGGELVFHATGDIGNTRGPQSEDDVVGKMIGDFSDPDPSAKPQFALLLGDIVYSFGEAQYYYDQFYEPYKDYPAPILAAAGNHDGMPNPLGTAQTLSAFLDNFCAESFRVTPDAGGLSRTAQIQPGVFFTFEAPFVRILILYSNVLEDPGSIADDNIGDSQIAFLDAALKRVKKEAFKGALIFAHHHPNYSTPHPKGWSVEMTHQIDQVCKANGVWPHAVLSGHAHNYQRFTRTRADGTQTVYLVCGNGGHAPIQKLSKGETLRAPMVVQTSGDARDKVSLDSYDDQDFGYLRISANATQLRVEYHPASDGTQAKTPDDSVTVDLKHRILGAYQVPDRA